MSKLSFGPEPTATESLRRKIRAVAVGAPG